MILRLLVLFITLRNSLPARFVVEEVKCLTPFKTFIILEDISVGHVKFKDKSMNERDEKSET